MFNFLKKRVSKGLEKARDLDLITENEFLKLKVWRADEELKKFLGKGKKKKKK